MKSKIEQMASKRGKKIYYRENGKLVPIEGLTLLVHKHEYTRNNKARGIVKGDFLVRRFILRDEDRVRLSHHPIYNPRRIKTYLLVEEEE